MNRRRIDGVAALRPHVGGGCGRRSARSGRRPRPALFRLSLSNPQRGFCGSRVGAARLCHLPCAAVAAAVAVVAAAARLGEARRPTRAEIRSLTGKGGGGARRTRAGVMAAPAVRRISESAGFRWMRIQSFLPLSTVTSLPRCRWFESYEPRD